MIYELALLYACGILRFSIAHRMVFAKVKAFNYLTKLLSPLTAFITKARKLNVKKAIYDFGTGYSNFENLYRLKSDFIKIDGSLIQNIYFMDSTRGVLKAIVAFAKSCGSKTIAESVLSEADCFLTSKKQIHYP